MVDLLVSWLVPWLVRGDGTKRVGGRASAAMCIRPAGGMG